MIRRIVKHGPASLTVSLPSKWLKAQNLKKGDDISIVEKGDALVISKVESSEQKSTSYDLTDLDRGSIVMIIRSLYIQGYDEIKLTWKKEEAVDQRRKFSVTILDDIYREVSGLQGIEVFSHTKSSCILRGISIESEKEFDRIFNRILYLLAETLKEFKEGYANKDKLLLKNIENRHSLIQKFIYFCLRTIYKKLDMESSKKKFRLTTLFALNWAIDAIRYCASSQSSKVRTPSKTTLKIIEQLENAFSDCIRFQLADNVKNVRQVRKKVIGVIDLIESNPSDNKQEVYIRAYLLSFAENLRKIIFCRIGENFSKP